MTTAPAGPAELLELDEIAERLGRTLELATADSTEIAWVESAGGRARSDGAESCVLPARRSVMIRVREGSRRGSHCTASPEPGEILAGVRQAVAASRAAPPRPLDGPWTEEGAPEGDSASQDEPRERPARGDHGGESSGRWDETLARLEPADARERLAELARHQAPLDARLALDWRLLRVVVRSDAGVDRRAQVTAATFDARVAAAGHGERSAGSARMGPWGWAAGAARSLPGLDAERIVARARERLVDGAAGAAPAGGPGAEPLHAPHPEGPIVFSPEAAAALVAILVRRAFAASAFESERSPLTGLLGEHVFAEEIDLVDDGDDPAGLPFPFDLLGRDAARIGLIEAGVPRTPAVDELLAARLKRPITPHAVGPDDARPTHPFLLSRHPAGEVLAAGDGGLWIGGFDELECFDPGRVAVRGRAVGARRVRSGVLAEPVGPIVWEDSLLRLFSKVAALGGEPVVRMDDGGLGGVSAPMICVEGAEALRPA